MKPRNSWSGSVSRTMGAIVQQDLIWREVLDLRVTQDKAIVDVANMANKQMVIGKD